MKVKFIVNPKSGGNDHIKEWPAIERHWIANIGPAESEFTEGPGHATELTRAALKEGFPKIIAVGGDGTLSECINGFYENDKRINPNAIFSFIMRGRGNDFRKSHGIADSLEAAIHAAAYGIVRKTDIGRIHYIDFEGREKTRYFLNLASFGMSGEIDRRVNKSKMAKYLGGPGVFIWCTLQSLVFYKSQSVRLQVDENVDTELSIRLVAAANGQYAGGGMWFAPHAQLCDGLFDIVIVKDVSRAKVLMNFAKIFKGAHTDHPDIEYFKGRKITATGVGPGDVFLDIDGEAPGKLPATLEVLPESIRIQS